MHTLLVTTQQEQLTAMQRRVQCRCHLLPSWKQNTTCTIGGLVTRHKNVTENN